MFSCAGAGEGGRLCSKQPLLLLSSPPCPRPKVCSANPARHPVRAEWQPAQLSFLPLSSCLCRCPQRAQPTCSSRHADARKKSDAQCCGSRPGALGSARSVAASVTSRCRACSAGSGSRCWLVSGTWARKGTVWHCCESVCASAAMCPFAGERGQWASDDGGIRCRWWYLVQALQVHRHPPLSLPTSWVVREGRRQHGHPPSTRSSCRGRHAGT